MRNDFRLSRLDDRRLERGHDLRLGRYDPRNDFRLSRHDLRNDFRLGRHDLRNDFRLGRYDVRNHHAPRSKGWPPLKQGAKYSMPVVREHIVRRTVIALDQAADFHYLHCARDDPDRRVTDVRRGAKRDDALACRNAARDGFRSR